MAKQYQTDEKHYVNEIFLNDDYWEWDQNSNSYVAAKMITECRKPFTDGEFVKEICLIKQSQFCDCWHERWSPYWHNISPAFDERTNVSDTS